MKRCATCNRTFTDPSLSFCIDDGTPLTPVASEEESTVVSPRTTENAGDNWSTPAYRPPGSYVPPGTGVRRRRAWPWILGLVGAFVLGIIAIGIAAAILAPRFMRPGRNDRVTTNANQTSNANRTENSNAAATNSNANAVNSNQGAVTEPNSNVKENVDTPPPADHQQVLTQLTDLENDWTAANFNADKEALDRILADDYVGPDAEGQPQSKAEYLRIARRDTTVDRWELGDLKLVLAGDRATLSGKITYATQNRELVYDFTDKFVWREGRWQATGSTVAPRQ
jgi:Domain of unknown function (DUF4440)